MRASPPIPRPTGLGRAPASSINDLAWINPDPLGKYDLVILGAGSAGRAVMESASALGIRIALIDRDPARRSGAPSLGSCFRQTLLAASAAAGTARHAMRLGVKTPGGLEVDLAKILARARKAQGRLGADLPAGVDFFVGEARFLDRSHVTVGDAVLEFAKAAICTGSRAPLPWISGSGSVSRLSESTPPSLDELPGTMAVLGTGSSGCELAQAFARLGVSVSLIGPGPGVLEGEDPHAATLVKERMRRDGVKLLCCAKDARMEAGEFGGTLVQMSSHGESHQFTVECVLDASEGIPDFENLGLMNAGVAVGEAGIRVDSSLRTSNAAIFAMGPVCASHRGADPVIMADTLIKNAILGKRQEIDFTVLPRLIRTGPEVARVGMQAEDAERLGTNVESLTHSFLRYGHAAFYRQTDGFVRLHVARGTGRILGATVVGPAAGEIIGILALAIKADIGIEGLAGCPFPDPTFSQAIHRIGRGYRPSGRGGIFRKRPA